MCSVSYHENEEKLFLVYSSIIGFHAYYTHARDFFSSIIRNELFILQIIAINFYFVTSMKHYTFSWFVFHQWKFAQSRQCRKIGFSGFQPFELNHWPQNVHIWKFNRNRIQFNQKSFFPQMFVALIDTVAANWLSISNNEMLITWHNKSVLSWNQ